MNQWSAPGSQYGYVFPRRTGRKTLWDWPQRLILPLEASVIQPYNGASLYTQRSQK